MLFRSQARHIDGPEEDLLYLQGIAQSPSPDRPYGHVSSWVVEDVLRAASALRLVRRDFWLDGHSDDEGQLTETAGADTTRENPSVNHDAALRLRRRLENDQDWGDDGAWLIDSMWLALPCHFDNGLSLVIDHIGIQRGPFVGIADWLHRHNILAPADLVQYCLNAEPTMPSVQPYDTHSQERYRSQVLSLLQASG